MPLVAFALANEHPTPTLRALAERWHVSYKDLCRRVRRAAEQAEIGDPPPASRRGPDATT